MLGLSTLQHPLSHAMQALELHSVMSSRHDLRQPLGFHDAACKVESKTGSGDGKVNFSSALLQNCLVSWLFKLSLSEAIFFPQPQPEYLLLTVYSLKLNFKLCPPVPVHLPAFLTLVVWGVFFA